MIHQGVVKALGVELLFSKSMKSLTTNLSQNKLLLMVSSNDFWGSRMTIQFFGRSVMRVFKMSVGIV